MKIEIYTRSDKSTILKLEGLVEHVTYAATMVLRDMDFDEIDVLVDGVRGEMGWKEDFRGSHHPAWNGIFLRNPLST